ncbi:N-acetylglucosamine-1-phosphate transferase, putative [Babesia caballi]|uniref:N-acetylglucosamine-1-phosphate transferase, putative n=1 Tax=Babesia caballi TaxID=5871 RepID=A0AAV4M1A5_BABCB|nr:N-acetylglucosamine-1-phosphate transferase, putative [Babesia caballi]
MRGDPLRSQVRGTDLFRTSLAFEGLLAALVGVPYAVVATVLCIRDDQATNTAYQLATCFPLAIASYAGIPYLVASLRQRGLCNRNLHLEEGAEMVAEPGSLWACALYLIYVVGLGSICRGHGDPALFYVALVAITLMTLMVRDNRSRPFRPRD